MLYTALEELNFIWRETDVNTFDQMWNEGYSLDALCKYFGRTKDEVAILIIDRSLMGAITPRPYGLFPPCASGDENRLGGQENASKNVK